MASVGAYLKKLLFQYDCVVVPELGGFLTHYQPASFVADTGQFLPPRKRLAFNEALRLDDGILINYITLHESISREEAVRMIGDFVNNLKQHVSLAGSFSVDGIGLFTPNFEGKLQFDPELRHNFFGESFGMTAIQAERVAAIPVEAVDAEEVMPVYSLGSVRREEVLEEGPFVRVSRSRPLLRWAAAAVLVGSLGAISYVSVIEPGQPMESSLNPADWFRMPTWLHTARRPVVEPKSEIVIAARPADPAKTPVFVPPPVPVRVEPTPTELSPVTAPVLTESTPVAEKKTVAVVPVKTTIAKTKPVVEKSPVKVPVAENPFTVELNADPKIGTSAPKAEVKRFSGPLFTVVAGSFASKPNAIRFRKTLRKAGYLDAFIIPPTRKGQLYKVAAIGSPVREEAIASSDSLKQLTGIAPFILKN
ncbi:MAG: SPOR domain-containing protein [Rudanella sp.]|nr:SPOR domain-containing protein [Rudanella sp.]